MLSSRTEKLSGGEEIPVSKSLYERLGGAEGLSAIVQDTLDNHLANPLVKMRFE